MATMALGTPQVVTALPSSPVDGQEIYFTGTYGGSSEPYVWHLRYRASLSTYQWEYVGGAALQAEDGAQVALSTSLIERGTAMRITCPLSGIYEYDQNFRAYNTSASTIRTTQAVFSNGVIVPDSSGQQQSVSGDLASAHKSGRLTGVATTQIDARSAESIGAANSWIDLRSLRIRPIRVG